MTDNPPPLGAGPSDHISTVLRMGVSAIPVAGGAFSELITRIIPGVRVDRIEEYLRWLTEKLQDLTDAQKAEKLADPEKIWIFEEGAYQSARGTSEMRREQIANIVAAGIAGEIKASTEARRLLNLISQVDDAQIIILASYLTSNMFDNDYQKRHENILTGPALHMKSPRQDIDRGAVHDLGKSQLVTLGLLSPQYKRLKKGEMPEFDPKTGMMKRTGYQLTPLGRLLLRRVGLASEDEV